MKSYDAYLIDLDGTIYRGKEEIPEAKPFIDELKKRKIPYRFVTNNSSRTPEQTVEKLARFGIEATVELVVTASLATAQYVKNLKPHSTANIIGETGLIQALEEAGIKTTHDHPDFVIMGIDRELTYKKLVEACIHVQQGASLIATNPDIKVPTEKGLVPGNGSFVQLVENVTGVKPTIIGKPKHYMLKFALDQLKVEPSNALMVGDNYHTDMMAGIKAGLDTLHVQTGVTLKDELLRYSIQPTYSIENLSEWRFD